MNLNKYTRTAYSLETNIYRKLVGFLIRKGYKANAVKMLNLALLLVVKKTGYSFSYLVWQIFRKAFTRIEVRSVFIKGKSFLVPFTISKKRRQYIVTKWLLKAIKESKKKGSVSEIIAEEICLLVLNKKSKVLEYKEKNYKSALANKANLHYRW